MGSGRNRQPDSTIIAAFFPTRFPRGPLPRPGRSMGMLRWTIFRLAAFGARWRMGQPRIFRHRIHGRRRQRNVHRQHCGAKLRGGVHIGSAATADPAPARAATSSNVRPSGITLSIIPSLTTKTHRARKRAALKQRRPQRGARWAVTQFPSN